MSDFKIVSISQICPCDLTRKAELLDIVRQTNFYAYLIPKEQVCGKTDSPIIIYATTSDFRYIKDDAQPIECKSDEDIPFPEWSPETMLSII